MPRRIRKRQEIVRLSGDQYKAWVEIQVGVFPNEAVAEEVRREVLLEVLPVVARVRNECLDALQRERLAEQQIAA